VRRLVGKREKGGRREVAVGSGRGEILTQRGGAATQSFFGGAVPEGTGRKKGGRRREEGEGRMEKGGRRREDGERRVRR